MHRGNMIINMVQGPGELSQSDFRSEIVIFRTAVVMNLQLMFSGSKSEQFCQ